MGVPEGWEKHPIGKICKSIVPGRNKPKSFDGTIPWITTPDIQGRYLPSKAQRNFISETAIRESGAKIVPAGGVVIAAVGELGLTAIAAEPIVLNQQLHAFICPDSIYNEYLAYWLETQKHYMDSVASKTTIPYMNKSNCESIPVIFPPLPEQKKIARILSTWDRAIEITEKLLKNGQQQKKALMQQLLIGKKRLPGFSGRWTEYRLEEIFTFKKGKGLSKAAVSNKGKNKCILYGELYTHYPEVIKNVISFTDSHDGTKSVAGDVLIPSSTTTSGIDLANATAIMEDGVLLGGDINILRPNIALVNSSFIAHLLTHIKKHDIAKRAQGITIIHLYGNDLKHLTVSLPELKAQEKISKILADTTHEIEILEQKLSCLRQEKKALMQQLLTGKRRVVL